MGPGPDVPLPQAHGALDAVVCGGGPAGTAAATLLASWGRRVALISRPADVASPTLAESIPPSADKLIRLIGFEADLDAAQFPRSAGNTVWWGEAEPRVEGFGAGRFGWQANTLALERTLHAAARRAGVQVIHERVESLDAVRARWSTPWVIDATGRSGLVARARGWRRFEPNLRTVALVAVWEQARWAVPDESHTLIESYADGWAWSVPVGRGRRQIAVMVDPQRSDLARGTQAEAVYRSQIQKTRQFAALVASARLHAGPWGWDASMYASSHYAEPGCLLVGDAGSFVDPLSSTGVKKALASGWLAAIAVNTSLTDPSMRGPALEFFDTREREIYAHFRALTMKYFADGGRSGAAFWTDRADPTDPEAPDAIDPRTADAARAAYESLRAAPELRVSRGFVTIAARPAIHGRLLSLEPRLITADQPAGVRYLYGVDLLALLDLAPAHRNVGSLYEAVNEMTREVPLPDFLRALSIALARGWLVC